MQIRSCVFPLVLLLSLGAQLVLADSANQTFDQKQLSTTDDTSQGKTWGTSLLSGRRLIQELQKGGYVIYLRHTATEQKIEQWDDIDLLDCSTQRNLSEQGRQQGLRIGVAFSSLGIKLTKVVTSPFCRCIETGRIAFGTVEISSDLLFIPGRDQILEAALGKMLGTRPLDGTNTMLVSHGSNLIDTTGIDLKPEGAAVIFKPEENGSYSYVATVLPEGWDYLLNEK